MTKKTRYPHKTNAARKEKPAMVEEQHIVPTPVVAKPAEKTFMQKMFS